MPRLRTHVIPAIVAALVAVVGFLVYRPETEAGWLRVEAPSSIAAGEPFIATVTLLEPADGSFLVVDLHSSDTGEGPVQVAAAGPSQAVVGGQQTFSLALVLRDLPDVSRVHAVVFLSRSGQWGDAFRVARSESLPVVRDAPRVADTDVRPLRVYERGDAPAIELATAALLRTVIAALWLGAAAVAAGTLRRSRGVSAAGMFVVVCLVLAAWEALAAGSWISDHARPLARAVGLYEERRVAQQMATVAVVGVIGLLAAVALRRSGRWLPALALAGVGLYAIVSLAAMLSLHEVDRLLATGVGPWPLADVLRLAGACAALAGAARRAQ